MQIIAVDIGNSAIKLLSGEDCLRLPHQSDAPELVFADAMTKYVASIDASGPFLWVVASVNDSRRQQLEDWIKQNRREDRIEIVTRERVRLGIVGSYRKTVGIDRLVAAYAAVSLQQAKDTPLIIVDAGTAVTIDVVSSGSTGDGHRFEGGLIFPGAAACLGVLNSATADLPDVALSSERLNKSDSVKGIIGTETDMAIANGVRLSQSHAVGGIVASLKQHLPSAQVWVTGGGAEGICQLMDDEVASQWISDAKLVLRGAITIGQEILSSENAD